MTPLFARFPKILRMSPIFLKVSHCFVSICQTFKSMAKSSLYYICYDVQDQGIPFFFLGFCFREQKWQLYMGSHRVFFPQSQKQQAEQQHAFESRREISLRRSVGTVLAGFPTRHFALFSVGSPFVSRTFIIKDAMCVLRYSSFFPFQSQVVLSSGIHVQERQNWMTAVVGFSTTSSPSGCCTTEEQCSIAEQGNEDTAAKRNKLKAPRSNNGYEARQKADLLLTTFFCQMR